MRGIIIAAPNSGSGKTTITLGLLRALRRAGHPVRSAKSGPDYIDPAFHAAATGRPCVNLDAWAMTPDRIAHLATGETDLIIEGAMGLFDGAPPDGAGATADLARQLGLPVVLVVNAGAMSQSVAALVQGFARFDDSVQIAAVILNNVGSDRHRDMLMRAMKTAGVPVLACIPRSANLSRPSRHLGLVQAGEMPDLDGFLDAAADVIAANVDLTDLKGLMREPTLAPATTRPSSRSPASISVARDAAFSFIYPRQIADWTAAGTQINWFSPLADEAVPDADAVFLPGGYPELHAARLAGNSTFMQSLKYAAQDADIYGECGGYMTLGETLIDADGTSHKMAGLLGLTTSFADRKLHLGYRTLEGLAAVKQGTFKAHEFHYATTVAADGAPLFEASDAEGNDLGQIGLVEGRVAGSFAHIIDPV